MIIIWPAVSPSHIPYLSGYFLILPVLVTSECATWALASSSRSMTWSRACEGCTNGSLATLLAAQPTALAFVCEETDTQLEERTGAPELADGVGHPRLGMAGLSKRSSCSSGGPSGCQSSGRGAGRMPVLQLLPSLLLAARNFSSICSFRKIILGGH